MTQFSSEFEASEIRNDLWQGSAPPFGDHVRAAGFHTLVLCAQEFQPEGWKYTGVEVIHAPNDDADRRPDEQELRTAVEAASAVAKRLRSGRKVLVTCMQGRNRSGLVSAIALHKLLGVSGHVAARIVRANRRNALTNVNFVNLLRKLPPRARVT